MKKSGKLKYYILLGCIAIALISWDISSINDIQVDYPLYKKLADIDATTGATEVNIAVISSDYSELKNPATSNTTLTYEQIEDMVRTAIDKQGSSVWLFKPGIKVLIKPNIVEAVASGAGDITDVRVVKALIKVVHEKCDGNVLVIIAEGSPRPMEYEMKYQSKFKVAQWKVLWDKAGYPDLLTDPYLAGIKIDTVNLNGSPASDPWKDLVEVDVPNAGFAIPQKGKYFIHKALLEADVYISVPVLKVHTPGITCALKNQIGLAPSTKYGFSKTAGIPQDNKATRLRHYEDSPRDWTDEEIVDLSLLAGIDLVVVDATLCLEKEKTFKGSNQVRMNTIIVGNDPVAIDKIACDLTGFNADDLNYLNLAELVGMGTKDSASIKIIGTPVEKIKKRFRKNSNDIRLVFGEGNRKWLISKLFQIGDIANPMSHQFITNEAKYKAKPGIEGWSEALYFFDDRIDLGNYFGYASYYIAYTFTNLYVPKKQEAVLWIGSDESIYVYLNDSLVYNYDGVRTYNNLLSEKKKIQLKHGNNTLLVKTLQKYGNHDFALNICEVENDPELEGHRVAGLKFLPVIEATKPDQPNTGLASNPSISFLKFYPNPASVSTTIDVMINKPDTYLLNVYDLNGKFVKQLINKYLSAGKYSFTWNLNNRKGKKVANGLYIVKNEASKTSLKLVVGN